MNLRARLALVLLFPSVFNMFTLLAQDKNWEKSAFESIEQDQYNFKADKRASNPYQQFGVLLNPLSQTLRSFTPGLFNYTLTLSGLKAGNVHYPLNDQPQYISQKSKLLEQHRAFTLEYLNRKTGLKQNIIVNQRIGHAPILQASLEFSSHNCVLQFHNQQIHIVQKTTGLHVATYNGLKVYDAIGKQIEARFDVQDNTILIIADIREAIFPLTIDPVSTTPANLNTGTIANSQLGYCVSGAGDVNGDGYSDVVVGAPKYNGGQLNEGAVYIYHGSANGIGTTPALIIEGNVALPAYTDVYGSTLGFGTSVSEAGDVNGDGFGDIIVGSPYLSNGNNGEGKVFVYHGSASGLTTTPAWTYETNTDSTQLGFSVSGAGDVNNDGFSDVIVGAPKYSNGQNHEGAAFVFHGSATGLGAAPVATIEQNVAKSSTGWSVSAAGDVNGDDFDDVIVTAAFYNLPGVTSNEGKAYVFHGSASGIVTGTVAWTAEGNQAEAYYGENASWAGDVNGDGYADIIVGSDFYDNGQTDEGRAFIYHGSASGLNATAALTLEPDKAGANFGVGVNGAGDLNGDGYSDIVIGAYGYTGATGSAETNEGAIFVYYGSSAGILAASKVTIEANKINTEFGISVAGCGDVNGDGFSDIVAGAYLYDKPSPGPLTNAGAVYVFHGLPEGISTTPIPANPYTLSEANAGLGNTVTCIGDINADGFSDMAVGASLANNGGTDRGLVYIFHGSATGYGATPTTTLSGPAINNAQFGSSIGAAGDVNGDGFSDIIVGAPGYTNGQSGEGAAFIYHGSASGIGPSPTFTFESNQASAQLGYSVAGAGDVNGDGYSDVIIGAHQYNGGSANEGHVYVFHGSATGVDLTIDWEYETDVANEKLGACVAGVGDVNGDGYSDIIALSSGYTAGQTNEGRMLYFRGSDTGLELTPGSVYETNVTNALLGPQSSSYIGDINGDGFNDVVIGTQAFNSGGTANEGALLIYYGATPSLYFGSQQVIEGNATNNYMGATVGFGGDVNGDGYNDVITGSPLWTSGQTQEGRARIFTGSASGLSSTAYFTFEPDLANVNYGSSVSAAGDANGDGYSDIVIGANNYDAGAAPLNVGRIYVYMGNSATNLVPLPMRVKQYKSNLITPVQTSNGTFETAVCTFGVDHFQRGYLARSRGKLVYEVRGHPHPFSGAGPGMGHSTGLSGQQVSYTSLGAAGATMTMGITVAGLGFPKWRLRTRYNPIDALDGQVFSRWYYGGIHDKQDRSIKVDIVCGALPIELATFETACINDEVMAQWTVLSESNIAGYKLLGSNDMQTFDQLGRISPDNRGQYTFNLGDVSYKYVRLVVIDNNLHTQQWDRVVTNCHAQKGSGLVLYPNPTSNYLGIQLDENTGNMESGSVLVIDAAGKTVYTSRSFSPVLDVSSLSPGIYTVIVYNQRGNKLSARFSRM